MSNPYDGGYPPYEPPPSGPYGGYAPGNPYGAPHQSERSVDGLSIAALVCSLTCCAAPVGIGLGIAGIVRTSGGRRSGRWAAITGLVISSLATLAMIAFVIFAGVMGSRAVYEDEVHVGQCINIDFLDDLAKAQCDEPHDAEVIAFGQFDDTLVNEYDTLSFEAFCARRELTPAHAAALKSEDYEVTVSADSFDEDEPDVGDWFVCYLERSDGESIEGRITEPAESTGA